MRLKDPPDSDKTHPMRLDKWLWAARFFKTRQMATDAINGGKVHVNGQRTKPGKTISIGTHLSITKEPYTWDIVVIRIEGQRRSGEAAALMYEEAPESLEKRLQEINKRRDEREHGAIPDHRPTKKERRQIHRFKRIEEAS